MRALFLIPLLMCGCVSRANVEVRDGKRVAKVSIPQNALINLNLGGSLP